MKLSDRQQEIVDIKTSVFVNAGAGTGKTRTMVEKFIKILANETGKIKETSVDEILAITFTNKAAGEMKERIVDTVEKIKQNSLNKKHWNKVRNRIPFAWISTIHSFATRILRENPMESTLDPSFEVLADYEEKKFIKEKVNMYFEDYENDSSIEKLSPLINIYGYKGLINLMENCLISKRTELLYFIGENTIFNSDDENKIAENEFVKVFETILEEYRIDNRKNNRIDFTELLLTLKQMLETHEKFREKMMNRFKYIMVDEFQDTNPLQKGIIDLIKGDDTKVIYVGDGKQSIYKFNGSDIRIYNMTESEFEGNSVLALDENYRSNPHLIDFFNEFFPCFIRKTKEELKNNYETYYHPLKPKKGFDYEKNELIKPENTKCVDLLPISRDFEDECKNISRYIQREINNGAAFNDFVILFRRMKNIDILEETLKEYGIPYFIQSSKKFFSRDEIISLKSFVKALYDPYNEKNMLVFLRSYFSPISDSELVVLRNSNKKSLYEAWQIYSQNEKNSSLFLEKFEKLRKKVNVSSPGRLIREIIKVYNYEFLLSSMDEPQKRLQNVNKFVEFADIFEGRTSLSEFLLKSGDTEEIDEEEASVESEKSDSVKIMTIHKSKGLEFKKVILAELGLMNKKENLNMFIDRENGRLIFKDENKLEESEIDYYRDLETDMNFEEEKRLLYVALTRAEDTVALSMNFKLGKDDKVPSPDRFKYIKMFYDACLLNEQLNWSVGKDGVYEKYIEIISQNNLNEYDKKIENNSKCDTISEIDSEMPSDIHIPDTLGPVPFKPYKSYISPTPLVTDIINDEIDETETEIVLENLVEEIYVNIENNSSSSKGIFVHKIMEYVGHKYRLDEVNEKIIQNIAIRNGYDLKFVPEITENFKRINQNESEKLGIFKMMYESNKLYSERTIRKKWNRYILSGVIDKFFLYENKWYIIDFKYAFFNKKSYEDKYRFQMEFYMYLLKELITPSPEKAFLVYLKDFNIQEVEFEEAFESRLKNKIENFEKNLI